MASFWISTRSTNMGIEVIGLDHIYLTVSDLEKSERFYDAAMTILGFRKNGFVNEGDRHVQYYNQHEDVRVGRKFSQSK